MSRNLEVHTAVLHYCTFVLEAAEYEQNVGVDTARGKQNLSKMINQGWQVSNKHHGLNCSLNQFKRS